VCGGRGQFLNKGMVNPRILDMLELLECWILVLNRLEMHIG